MVSHFMFANGIENSNSNLTINNGRTRVDETAKCGRRAHWRTDFDPAGTRHPLP